MRSSPWIERPSAALAIVVATALASPPVQSALAQGGRQGDPAGRTAQQIIDRTLAQDAFGWEGAEARLRMVLHNARGETRTRVMDTLTKRSGGLLSTVVRFREPAEVAGTAFLQIQRRGQEDDQYLYLPAIRRARRIVGRQREGSFMGSDFLYSDFERREVRDATHRRLPDEQLDGIACFVVESAPRSGPYGRVQSWIRQQDHLPLRVKFFDRQDRLLKTLYARRIRQEQGRPVISEARMVNHQAGTSTELFLDAIHFRADIPDAVFSPTALDRL